MTTMAERLASVTHLEIGKHSPDSVMCMMEAVAFVAGEPWTDTPQCASEVLASFCRALNDWLPDGERQRLIPYIPRLIGTRACEALERKRGLVFADAAVRFIAPLALERAGLFDQAKALRGLPAITTAQAANEASSRAAWAAKAAARVATSAATSAAAWAAAWAARDAASAAALTAAKAAARVATWAIVAAGVAEAWAALDRALAVEVP